MSRGRELLVNMGLFGLGSVATKLMIFICLPIYTLCLSSEEYAMLDLSQTTVMLLLPILSVSISDAVLRFVMKDPEDERGALSLGLRIVILAVLLMLAATPLVQLCFRNWIVSAAFQLYFALNAMNTLFSAYARAVDKVPVIAVSSIVSAVCTFGAVVLAIMVLHMGLLGFFLASDFGLLIGLLCYLIPLGGNALKALPFHPEASLRKQMLAFALPLVPNAVFWSLNVNAGKYILGFAAGLAAAGLFSAASKIPAILSAVVSIFQQAWNLTVFKEHDSGQAESSFSRRVFAYFRMINLAVALPLIAFAPLISRFFLQGEFYASWTLLPLLICGSYYSSISAYYGSFFSAAMRTRPLFTSTFAGAALNIALCLILIPFLAETGAAISFCASAYLVYLLRKRSLRQEGILSYCPCFQEGMGLCLLGMCALRMYCPWEALVYLSAAVLIVITFILFSVDKNSLKATEKA